MADIVAIPYEGTVQHCLECHGNGHLTPITLKEKTATGKIIVHRFISSQPEPPIEFRQVDPEQLRRAFYVSDNVTYVEPPQDLANSKTKNINIYCKRCNSQLGWMATGNSMEPVGEPGAAYRVITLDGTKLV